MTVGIIAIIISELLNAGRLGAGFEQDDATRFGLICGMLGDGARLTLFETTPRLSPDCDPLGRLEFLLRQVHIRCRRVRCAPRELGRQRLVVFLGIQNDHVTEPQLLLTSTTDGIVVASALQGFVTTRTYSYDKLGRVWTGDALLIGEASDLVHLWLPSSVLYLLAFCMSWFAFGALRWSGLHQRLRSVLDAIGLRRRNGRSGSTMS